MRKSIDVESLFGSITKEILAKGWKDRVSNCIGWLTTTANSENRLKFSTQLKEELEFAKANIDLLSEEDYKWLLEQEKPPAAESNNGVIPSFNCKICCDGHFSVSDVQGKTAKSDVEVMEKFKKAIPGFTAASNPKSSNGESSESQNTRWIVQITKGRDTYYRTLRTKNRMSPSIYDAKCYVSENAANQAANSVAIENRLLTLSTVNNGNIAESCVVDVKEVLCTESSSRTIEIVNKPRKSMDIDSPEFKEALASAPFVCKTHCDSEEKDDDLLDSPENHSGYTPSSKHTEIMDEFNKLPPYDSLASGTVKGAINKSDQPIAATESQTKFWVIQITKGKKVWYKTSGTFKGGYISPSINDAALYYTKADAAYFATFITPGNTRIYDLPFPVKVTLKEVVYTENSSRTVELVKPVDSTVKKVKKSKKVYLIQDKNTKQYVTKVDHSNFTEVELNKDISEARLYTSMGNAIGDCNYLSRYKDTNCKAQLEVVEMPDDEKFVLRVRNGASWSYFIKYHPISTLLTDNLDEATRYNSKKSSLRMEKKLDKDTYYSFTNAKVKDCVEPETIEKPITKTQVRAMKPKIKEEWVLYINGMNGVPWYYNGEINVPSYYSTTDLKDAVKFSSYGAATKAKCKLIKAGFVTLDVANVEDCK